MSDTSTLVTAAHFEYVAAHTTGDDDFLRQLKEAALAAGLPSIWVAPEQAAFMQILLRLVHACEVIEVGTLAGYSAIWMARSLPAGGCVRTIEVDTGHAAFAREWIGRSDVAEKIELYQGAGAEVLPKFADQSADAAFLDADKSSYPIYLREALRIVRRGGLIMVDNAFAFGQLLSDQPTDRDVPAVRAFNEYMSSVTQIQSVIVPVGDGLWVGVKL